MLSIVKAIITILFAYILLYKLMVIHNFTDTDYFIGIICIVIGAFVSIVENKNKFKEIERRAMSQYNFVSEKKWWQFWK